MLVHPLQLYPHLHPLMNRPHHAAQVPNETPSPIPIFQSWYPAPPQQAASERHPFPSVPAPPPDFASPIPLGQMVAMPSVMGFTTQGDNASCGGLCWDPVVGMYRTSAGNGAGMPSGVYEQMSSEGAAANAA